MARPSDDRFCEHCGGLTEWKQALEGETLCFYLWCWKCGRRRRMSGDPADIEKKDSEETQCVLQAEDAH